MTFCCPPSTALHQTTPNSPRSKFCLALLLPPTSTLDAVEASKHRFSSVARLFPHPSSPSRLSPTGEPPTTTHDVRPCFPQAVTRHDRLFRPPPPPRPPTLDCPSYNFILPRPTVRVARSSTGRSRSPPGRWISSGPKLAGRPAPDIHHITSRFRRSTQQASDELHDNFLTAHAHPAPGTFKSRFWPMTPWSETQDLVLLLQGSGNDNIDAPLRLLSPHRRQLGAAWFRARVLHSHSERRRLSLVADVAKIFPRPIEDTSST